jgi:hypothetical protein
MKKTFLRIIVSSPNELPFVRATIHEAFGCVDHIIVLEHNFTHTGKPKKYFFENAFNSLSFTGKNTRITYEKVDLSQKIIQNANTSKDMHFNEGLMRESFTWLYKIKPRDIVIAVDADEIIFRRHYAPIIEALNRFSLFPRGFKLPMNQFFYRMNYLWSDFTFYGAVAGHMSFLKRKNIKFRDTGKDYPEIVGTHFSWQLTVEQMLAKIGAYGHNADYRHLADKQILESAIRDKTYPFEPDRAFEIHELTRAAALRYYPSALWNELSDLEHLLPEGW